MKFTVSPLLLKRSSVFWANLYMRTGWFADDRNVQLWRWIWFKVLQPLQQMKAKRQTTSGERGNRFYLHTAKLSASFIVSCRPYIAAHIRCDVRVPFYLRLEFMLLSASFFSISARMQQNRVDQFLCRRVVPCGGHLDNQGYLMRPWGRWRRGGGRMEGKLIQELEGGGGASGGRWGWETGAEKQWGKIRR